MTIQHEPRKLSAMAGEIAPFALDPQSISDAFPAGPLQAWAAYWTDAAQRTALFLDVMRRRGDQQRDITARPMATVLTFDHEILMSGSGLDRPINFSLWRIVPPEGAAVDLRKRPVVIVDPRAGQGPGIGGFHYESEIGDAFAAGHQVYFIGFAANPAPGQTFLDVVEGQVAFFEHIVDQHPERLLPFVVGNCQAGYQTLMVAMLRPDLFGPILLSGSPMSCWQGVHGHNPMRYAGGLLGGSWMAHLASDLGGGRFDGAYLIGNFDQLNPANSLFDKFYRVYANVDTEADRFLDFERWWGDFIFLNGEEIEFLVDEHFIGNRLSTGGVATPDGRRFDVRSITSPIIVFTSLGDTISPPQQTLGWILDTYTSVEDIQQEGQTIVYCVDPKVGHLAIFVSHTVAEREDAAFMQMMNVIDVTPPGLYEIVLDANAPDADAASGRLLTRLEARTFDDIRAFGRNSEADDRAFAAMSRWSEVTLAGYRDFVQPIMRATANARTSEWLQMMNPTRAQYALFTSDQPWMQGVAEAAESARARRAPVDANNPFVLMQEQMAAGVDRFWNAYRDTRDAWYEHTFFAIYGNPVIQAALGLAVDQSATRHPPARTAEEKTRLQQRLDAYRQSIDEGDFFDARMRALLYVASADQRLDMRSAAAVQALNDGPDARSLDAIRTVVRKQYFALKLDRDAALAALPSMVPEAADRTTLLEQMRTVMGAAGAESPEVRARLNELEMLLRIEAPKEVWVQVQVTATSGQPAAGASPPLRTSTKAEAPMPVKAAKPTRAAGSALSASSAEVGKAAKRRRRPRAVSTATGGKKKTD